MLTLENFVSPLLHIYQAKDVSRDILDQSWVSIIPILQPGNFRTKLELIFQFHIMRKNL